jgi:hypothetical protein
MSAACPPQGFLGPPRVPRLADHVDVGGVVALVGLHDLVHRVDLRVVRAERAGAEGLYSAGNSSRWLSLTVEHQGRG